MSVEPHRDGVHPNLEKPHIHTRCDTPITRRCTPHHTEMHTPQCPTPNHWIPKYVRPTAMDHFAQRRAHLRWELGTNAIHDKWSDAPVGQLVERRPESEHLKHHHAETIHIRSRAIPLVRKHLGRCPMWSLFDIPLRDTYTGGQRGTTTGETFACKSRRITGHRCD